MNSDEEKTI